MSKPQSKTLLRLTLAMAVFVMAIFFSVSGTKVSGAGNPSVVINKYFNSGLSNGANDVVELLVIQNNLDMRGMIVKDFSSNMANDGGGKYQFTTNALWSSVPAGTLIVLRFNNSAADTTVGPGDFNVDVGLQNTTYFTNVGGTSQFDIATTEMVMIKAAGSGATGVTGSIHALAGGTAGAQFTATAVPKLIASGTSSGNQFVYANNSTQSINDFDGTDATGAATGLTFGIGNNPNNTAFINSLRVPSFSLTVTPAGSGTGTVISNPSGINCGANCTSSFAVNTSVTLTATANGGSNFTGWSGCDSFSGNQCTVSMTSARSVTATFTVVQQTLSVTKNGTGGGTVTSSPAGINCGATCSSTFNNGTPVTLTAVADGTSNFTTWSGCDSFSGNQCNVTMNSAHNVTATFTTTQKVLTVNPTGTGTGTVTSSPAGINCGATCTAIYADNTPVTLTASVSGTNTFNGWTGCDSSSGNTCNVTMTADKTVSASFTFVPTPPGAVVISQLYGGGGNAGALYKNDFIELFNRSSNPVDLSGWTVQYNSATGTGSWSGKTSLSGVIPAGGYYLVQEAAGNGGTANLPAPDATGSIAMALGVGKVALVNNTMTLTGCPSGASIIDLVGYGSTANCSEGNSPTADLGNTLAAIRTHQGCRDTDVNGSEFRVLPPSPRNSSTPLHICAPGDLPPEVFSTAPNDSATSVPVTTAITVKFDEPVNVSGNWYSISCAASGLHTATAAGDGTTFTITPDIHFTSLDQCTITIFAGQVSDQDFNNNLEANYSWTFLTGHDPEVHLTMGNPSNATPDVNNENNYLMEKDQYALSYNRSKATANWVSWQLDQTWLGSAPRQNDFRADDTLPAAWYHVQQGDYQFATYGFDRGHMCPSADRTASIDDNSHTFLMTNMVPQASGNNQGPWGDFENYLRDQIGGGANRLYIVSGPAGVGGVSSTGSFNTITTSGGGTITVPAWTWKVALVLPVGNNDLSRVDTSTRTIAVIMPNHDNIGNDDWRKYLATVDQVEALSGFDFYSNVPTAVQNVIESRLDSINDTAPIANGGSDTVAEDGSQSFTLSASDFNVNNILTFTVNGGPSHGTLGAVSAPTCSNGNCTATVSYTPSPNYNGPDSFSFSVNDGAMDSNTASFNVNVTEVNDDPTAVNDSKTVAEDSSLSFAASDLTTNDSAGPNEATQTLTVDAVITTPNTHGTVVLNAGQITYTPDGNYNGGASFDYHVCDNGTTNGSPDAKCTTATVNVTVTPVNDAPTAFNQTGVTTDSNSPVNIVLTGTDLETPSSLTFAVTSGPSHGGLSGSGANLTYTPATDFAGADSFTFTVTDAGDGTSPPLTSLPATISITVADKVPPVINLNDNSISLWPLNKSMRTISVSDLVAGATDNFDPTVSVFIASVSSDEGTAASGDIVIASDCKSVQLRQTRDGNGDGRVYLITFAARDAAGNTAFATAQITVPHDQGGAPAVASPVAYTINSTCH